MSAHEQGAGQPAPSHPIEDAKAKTVQVKEQLELAGAELHLSNSVMRRSLARGEQRGEVRKALDQYAQVEEKVVDAAEELNDVTELLEEEIAERQRLELALERLSSSST